MRTDEDIRHAVELELRSRPRLDESRISAHVDCGIVRLSGFACSYCEKFDAEEAARRASGVAGVVNEIEVRLTSAPHLPDAELECAARCALQTEVPSVQESVRIHVHEGEVVLDGTSPSHFLKERAESAVRRLGGVTVVHNQITVEPQTLAADVRQRIERSLGQREARNLSVAASQGEVILRGEATSETERQLIERAAWSVPDVTRVQNEITVAASASRT